MHAYHLFGLSRDPFPAKFKIILPSLHAVWFLWDRQRDNITILSLCCVSVYDSLLHDFQLVSLLNRTAFYAQTISVFNIVIFGLAALSRLYDDEPEKMVAGLAGIFVNVVLLCGVKV